MSQYMDYFREASLGCLVDGYSLVFGRNSLQASVRAICFLKPFNSDVFMFTFCPDNLSIGEGEGMHLPTIAEL